MPKIYALYAFIAEDPLGTLTLPSRFWKFSSTIKDPELQLLHRYPNAHSGTIEAINSCGDILFTCGGGSDGIKTWNALTGEYLGQIRNYGNSQGKNSAVVGFLMERHSIVYTK